MKGDLSETTYRALNKLKEGALMEVLKKQAVDPYEAVHVDRFAGLHRTIPRPWGNAYRHNRDIAAAIDVQKVEQTLRKPGAVREIIHYMKGAPYDTWSRSKDDKAYNEYRLAYLTGLDKSLRARAGRNVDSLIAALAGPGQMLKSNQWVREADYIYQLSEKLNNAGSEAEEADVEAAMQAIGVCEELAKCFAQIAAVEGIVHQHASIDGQPDPFLAQLGAWARSARSQTELKNVGALEDGLKNLNNPENPPRRLEVIDAIARFLESPDWQRVDRQSLAAEMVRRRSTDPNAYVTWIDQAKSNTHQISQRWPRLASTLKEQLTVADNLMIELTEKGKNSRDPEDFQRRFKDLSDTLDRFRTAAARLAPADWDSFSAAMQDLARLNDDVAATASALRTEIAKVTIVKRGDSRAVEIIQLAEVKYPVERLDTLRDVLCRQQLEQLKLERMTLERADILLAHLKALNASLKTIGSCHAQITGNTSLAALNGISASHPWTRDLGVALAAALQLVFEDRFWAEVSSRLPRLEDSMNQEGLESHLRQRVLDQLEREAREAMELVAWSRRIEDGEAPRSDDVRRWSDDGSLPSMRAAGKLPDGLTVRLGVLRRISAEAPRRQDLIELAQQDQSTELRLAAWRRLHELKGWPIDDRQLDIESEIRRQLRQSSDRAGSTGRAALKKGIDDTLAGTALQAWRQYIEAAYGHASFAKAARFVEEFDVKVDGAVKDRLAPGARLNLALYELGELASSTGARQDLNEQLNKQLEDVRRRAKGLSAMKLLNLLGDENLKKQVGDPGSSGPANPRNPAVGLWRNVAVDGETGTVTYTSPDNRRLTFVPVTIAGSTKSYVCTTEVPLGLFMKLLEHAELRQLLGEDRPKGDPTRNRVLYPRNGYVSAWSFRRAGTDGSMDKSDSWLYRSGVAPPEARRVVDFFRERGGGPDEYHPMTNVSPWVAAYAASVLGCRLPSTDEWKAACAMVGQSPQPNLRDDTSIDADRQLEAALRDVVDFNTLFKGTFENSVKENLRRGQRSGEATRPDRFALFSRVDEQADAANFKHLVGNAAEFTFDKPGDLDEALRSEQRPGPERFRGLLKDNSAHLKIAGASALSLELNPADPSGVAGTELRFGFSDVGFRLAFTAGQPLATAIKVVLAGNDLYIRPTR
jgi:hypothetical protein